MARSNFGGTMSDFVIQVAGGGLIRLGEGTLTFWDAVTGGTQYTDLLLGGQPVSSITVSSGFVPVFQGPDSVTQMWADAGGERVLIVALADVADAAAASATAADGSATAAAASASEVAGAVDANDSLMKTVDADPESDFRVQQDARLNAAYVGLPGARPTVSPTSPLWEPPTRPP